MKPYSGWTSEQFAAAVKSSTSIAGVLRKLGLKPCGGNYSTFKRMVLALGLDISHFSGQGHGRGRRGPIPLADVLVVGRYTDSNRLRKRLISEKLLEYKCSKCGRTKWLGEPIPLELDHINGDALDNRLENLRVCCPNCHSLTPTYRGKNRGRAWNR